MDLQLEKEAHRSCRDDAVKPELESSSSDVQIPVKECQLAGSTVTRIASLTAFRIRQAFKASALCPSDRNDLRKLKLQHLLFRDFIAL